MNDQSQTAANTPSEPTLCKMGCGFFVSTEGGAMLRVSLFSGERTAGALWHSAAAYYYASESIANKEAMKKT